MAGIAHRGQALRGRPSRQPDDTAGGPDHRRPGPRYAEEIVASDHVAPGHGGHDGNAGARGPHPGCHADGGGEGGRLHRVGRLDPVEPGRRHSHPRGAAPGHRQRGPVSRIGAFQESRGGLRARPSRLAGGPHRQGSQRRSGHDALAASQGSWKRDWTTRALRADRRQPARGTRNRPRARGT